MLVPDSMENRAFAILAITHSYCVNLWPRDKVLNEQKKS